MQSRIESAKAFSQTEFQILIRSHYYLTRRIDVRCYLPVEDKVMYTSSVCN